MQMSYKHCCSVLAVFVIMIMIMIMIITIAINFLLMVQQRSVVMKELRLF
jgi:hypothetical protein